MWKTWNSLSIMKMNAWNIMALFLLPVNCVTGRHGVMTQFAARGHPIWKNEQLKMAVYNCLFQCESNPTCKTAEVTSGNVCIQSPQNSIIEEDQREIALIKGIFYVCYQFHALSIIYRQN